MCTGRPVAIKHLERLDAEEEGQGDEVSVLRALAHPNLLRIFEVVKFPGEVLIVTELAEQGSLSTYAAAAAAAPQPEGAPWIAGAKLKFRMKHQLQDFLLEEFNMKKMDIACYRCIIIDGS